MINWLRGMPRPRMVEAAGFGIIGVGLFFGWQWVIIGLAAVGYAQVMRR